MQEHSIKVKTMPTNTKWKYTVNVAVSGKYFFCLPLGIAKACEQNLKKTFLYGGRIVPPNGMEIKAMMVGSFVNLGKILKFLLETGCSYNGHADNNSRSLVGVQDARFKSLFCPFRSLSPWAKH